MGSLFVFIPLSCIKSSPDGLSETYFRYFPTPFYQIRLYRILGKGECYPGAFPSPKLPLLSLTDFGYKPEKDKVTWPNPCGKSVVENEIESRFLAN